MIALWLPGTPCVINYCCEGGLALFRSSAKVSRLPRAAQPRLALSDLLVSYMPLANSMPAASRRERAHSRALQYFIAAFFCSPTSALPLPHCKAPLT